MTKEMQMAIEDMTNTLLDIDSSPFDGEGLLRAMALIVDEKPPELLSMVSVSNWLEAVAAKCHSANSRLDEIRRAGGVLTSEQ